MSTIAFTPRQRQAIQTTGQSVIVSAAAGSGKTAVLTQRCAYLVCDAPPMTRCNVDELLVLTFTEAAAAEMRSRIIDAIRTRSEANPADNRLAQQVALVDAAQISTIHAFCLWLVRRWFTHLDVDPAATVLDADEAAVLKREVLDTLFAELYEVTRAPQDPLGRVSHRSSSDTEPNVQTHASALDAGTSPASSERATLAPAFVKLVDDYGLGDDRGIAEFVLKLYDFTASLPQPDRWLTDARTSLVDHTRSFVLAVADDLTRELTLQLEHCEQLAKELETGHEVGLFYASQIRAYVEILATWRHSLEDPTDESTHGKSDTEDDRSTRATAMNVGADDARFARFETVRSQIAEFEFAKLRAPNLPNESDPAVVQARDAARQALKHVKADLFNGRLVTRFALFSPDELVDGLKRTAPYVRTAVDLVRMFRDAYARKKRELSGLDFSDLERFAFDLLRSDTDPHQPSEVARSLHRRFAHVLVDEFQDVNPLQEAIIHLVSREVDPERADNLFVVGDVKQSIYRFRLAEPAVFSDRLDRCRRSHLPGNAIFLQENFRSAPEILEAVNIVFRQLMREGSGDVVYDDHAVLQPGRTFGSEVPRQPVELHVLERAWKNVGPDDETAERGTADLSDPARWAPIEREAYLIGSQIKRWIETGERTSDGQPMRFRDIAVLLRATKINAEHIAAMLNRMDVPAFAEVGGSLFGTREVRDVLAALQVLDNLQQDIPLTGVLRSGIFGESFSEDELVAIRCADRDVPFHEAVRQFAKCGQPVELSDRLQALMARISRYRNKVRRRPLADILWSLYQQQGYLAYAGGLPNGPQRRANLLRLHELARQFSSFRRQGLHRFLRFVQSLEEDERQVATPSRATTVAPPIGEAEDVVRIMSIHQAKGLEFPVVFVAGLGTKFNLGDRSGRMIFERKSRIGLRVVDTERMIEYPTAAHRQAAVEIEQSTRAEELRILYVAMTRARDRLVLVGSQRSVQQHRKQVSNEPQTGSPSLLSITTAVTPLDWLIPTLVSAPPGTVRGLGRQAGPQRLFDIHLHSADEMSSWGTVGAFDHAGQPARRNVARGEELPPDEPVAPGDPDAEAAIARIEFVYPYLAAASVRASLAASEFKGAFDYTRSPEEQPRPDHENGFQLSPARRAAAGDGSAVNVGMITHRVLQHLDFTKAVDRAGVAAELQRMANEGLVEPDALAIVNQQSIEWFVSTPLAGAIRKAGALYRREFTYVAAESLGVFDRSVDAPPDDYVLVRGIVDGILPVTDGIEIVDFKTDAVYSREVKQRAQRYRPQMTLYARAMARLWRRPVRACWLVFLTPRYLVRWEDVGDEATPD